MSFKRTHLGMRNSQVRPAVELIPKEAADINKGQSGERLFQGGGGQSFYAPGCLRRSQGQRGGRVNGFS